MILKRQEKDNKIKAMYSSSTILASIYDKEKNDLTVIFNKGGQYKYAGVSNTDYTRFELADSQGIVLNSHIKKYTFEKLSDVDPKAIITEIETIKATEQKEMLKAKQLELVKTMKELTTINDSQPDNCFNESQLTLLTDTITSYLTLLKK